MTIVDRLYVCLLFPLNINFHLTVSLSDASKLGLGFIQRNTKTWKNTLK